MVNPKMLDVKNSLNISVSRQFIKRVIVGFHRTSLNSNYKTIDPTEILLS